MAEFDVNAALKSYLDDPQSILTPEADSALVDCVHACYSRCTSCCRASPIVACDAVITLPYSHTILRASLGGIWGDQCLEAASMKAW